MRWQVFGLLPVTKPSDVQRASFGWTAPRTILTICIILGTVVKAVPSLMRMFESGIKYYNSGKGTPCPTASEAPSYNAHTKH